MAVYYTLPNSDKEPQVLEYRVLRRTSAERRVCSGKQHLFILLIKNPSKLQTQMENFTDAKLGQIASLLEQHAQDHVSILLTLCHLQSLHNEHITQEGLPTANEKFQIGFSFFTELMTIVTR